jgi:hypothetical protein
MGNMVKISKFESFKKIGVNLNVTIITSWLLFLNRLQRIKKKKQNDIL